MVKVYLSNDEYEYDIYSLVKEFYSDEQVKVFKDENDLLNSDHDLLICVEFKDHNIHIYASKDSDKLFSESSFISLTNKKEDRNIVKKVLYRCLNSLTGKELPWGTLTGIRPTKIAFEGIEQGKTYDEIKSYMKEQYLCTDDKIDMSLRVARREVTLLREMDYKNGYSIYIGIPFCPSTCLYCSFTSYSIERYEDRVEEYLVALFKEITYAATCYTNKKLSTIYLGGGTPTSLSAEQLDRLLAHIRNSLDFSHIMEYTVEAGRPDSITREKLVVLKKYGVTRISINPQTMNQQTLDIIGRKHTIDQLINAFHIAREVGHDNINMDIIIGLPGETKDDVAYTLQEIHKLQPDSLTVHTLAIKRAARLNIEKESYVNMVPTDTVDMLELTSEYTKRAGYEPYYLYRQKNMASNLENIGYAKFGKEGLYNILIMEERQTILALGAGGLCKFVFQDENRIERVENVKSFKDYIERIDEMIERKKNFLEQEMSKKKGNSDAVTK
jgi:oxygen-independent coproporphyrinogen-3 oxidase